jgi:hypothetical protein
MRIPETTQNPRFYVASGHNEALSSWDTVEEARACIEQFKAHESDQFILGIVTTDSNGRGFISKYQKPITPVPGGMTTGGPAYIVTSHDQGIHFQLVSQVIWHKYMSKINNTINDAIDEIFPAQEGDSSDDPEFKKHVRWFGSLWKLLKHIENDKLIIVSTHEEG